MGGGARRFEGPPASLAGSVNGGVSPLKLQGPRIRGNVAGALQTSPVSADSAVRRRRGPEEEGRTASGSTRCSLAGVRKGREQGAHVRALGWDTRVGGWLTAGWPDTGRPVTPAPTDRGRPGPQAPRAARPPHRLQRAHWQPTCWSGKGVWGEAGHVFTSRLCLGRGRGQDRGHPPGETDSEEMEHFCLIGFLPWLARKQPTFNSSSRNYSKR